MDYSSGRIIPMVRVAEGISMGANIADTGHSATWRRSTRCSPNLNCVEVSRNDPGVIIRDSKGKVALRVLDSAQWMTFLRYCRTMRWHEPR